MRVAQSAGHRSTLAQLRLWMTRRCLVEKCFNCNNGDEEKPRTSFNCALYAE